jgi:predicted dehydrogenase
MSGANAMTKVRYAIVGAGWISQEAFMPAVAQVPNAEMVAIVTGNADAAARLAGFHGIATTCGYDGYDALLASGQVDAVYIALPNSMHADYAIRAARAGVHALVEKPLAITADECRAMIAAADAAGTLLMTAYRLHCEPATVDIIERVRAGQIGDPRVFASVFSFQSGADNHRLLAEHWGGPLQDIGVYCINIARQIFGSQPTHVSAFQSATDDPRFREVAEMVTAEMRFTGDRIATFTASFNAQPNDWYRVMGTEGNLFVEPGYRFEISPRVQLQRGSETEVLTYPDVDHFGGQIEYFSDCIQRGEKPSCDGADGMADVVIMRAIEEAAATGRRVEVGPLPAFAHSGRSMRREVPRTTRRLVL